MDKNVLNQEDTQPSIINVSLTNGGESYSTVDAYTTQKTEIEIPLAGSEQNKKNQILRVNQQIQAINEDVVVILKPATITINTFRGRVIVGAPPPARDVLFDIIRVAEAAIKGETSVAEAWGYLFGLLARLREVSSDVLLAHSLANLNVAQHPPLLTKPEFPTEPPIPNENGHTWDDTFDWYWGTPRFFCPDLKTLSAKIAMDYGTVRKEHAKYIASREKGNKMFQAE